ncbi:FecCD family ABC transporter permease [Cohnella herbarum]|uniref:FecCD family ABC transporter permease n=1 Tax=Cohnella herbarum TaxID=2728023 RepID=UPI0020C39BDB|nr:iron ABC transporter permease [Cohnella herbarum]
MLTLNVILGERLIPAIEAIRTALGIGNEEYAFTIRQLRLPRALTGFLVGCGLALSGTILQIITRNPLASPGVIGLNSGAAAAVVAVITLIPSFPISRLPIVAFLGALMAAVIIYILSWRKGSSTVRMLLVGIAISAMAGALITYLLTIGEIFQVTQASIWMAGSLYGRTWIHFWPLLPWLALLFPLILLFARRLNLFQLGDESVKGLGIRLESTRFILILISVGLAGSAVSMAGTIAFVGLMAPHMALHLVGSSSMKRLPVAALIGGLFVMSADLLGRILFSPYEIPAGLITAVIGAPYMIYLLLRRNVI